MLKKLVCLVGGLALAACASAQTLVNGDFETGDLTGWTDTTDEGSGGIWAALDGATFPPAGPHTGSYCGAVVVNGGDDSGHLYQTVTGLSAYSVYKVSAWALTAGWNGVSPDEEYYFTNNKARVGVDPTGGTDPDSTAILWSDVRSPDRYYDELAVDFLAEDTTATVFLQCNQGESLDWNMVCLDDVSVSLAPGSAEPNFYLHWTGMFNSGYGAVGIDKGGINTGDNGICETTAGGDDVQEVAVGFGAPNEVCVEPGVNTVIDSVAAGDDTYEAGDILAGPNGTCDTEAIGDDIQFHALGTTGLDPTDVVVSCGDDGYLQTHPQVDDVVDGAASIRTGNDGICDSTALGDDVQKLNVGEAEDEEDCIDFGSNWENDSEPLGGDDEVYGDSGTYHWNFAWATSDDPSGGNSVLSYCTIEWATEDEWKANPGVFPHGIFTDDWVSSHDTSQQDYRWIDNPDRGGDPSGFPPDTRMYFRWTCDPGYVYKVLRVEREMDTPMVLGTVQALPKSTSAVISWTTTGAPTMEQMYNAVSGGQGTSAQVEYWIKGEVTHYFSDVEDVGQWSDLIGGFTHSIAIGNLERETTYEYTATSTCPIHEEQVSEVCEFTTFSDTPKPALLNGDFEREAADVRIPEFWDWYVVQNRPLYEPPTPHRREGTGVVYPGGGDYNDYINGEFTAGFSGAFREGEGYLFQRLETIVGEEYALSHWEKGRHSTYHAGYNIASTRFLDLGGDTEIGDSPVAVALSAGGNGECESLAAGDDEQLQPFGTTGLDADEWIVGPGGNGVLDTYPSGDDEAVYAFPGEVWDNEWWYVPDGMAYGVSQRNQDTGGPLGTGWFHESISAEAEADVTTAFVRMYCPWADAGLDTFVAWDDARWFGATPSPSAPGKENGELVAGWNLVSVPLEFTDDVQMTALGVSTGADAVVVSAGNDRMLEHTAAGDDVTFNGDVIHTGPPSTWFYGICDTAAAGDDVQVIPVGQSVPMTAAILPGDDGIMQSSPSDDDISVGQADAVCITAGANTVLDTAPSGDDQVVGETITTGANGWCQTAAAGDDVQVIDVNRGEPPILGILTGADGVNDTTINYQDEELIRKGAGMAGAECVTAGLDGILQSVPANDDGYLDSYITAGPNAVCDTAVDNYSTNPYNDDVQVAPLGSGGAVCEAGEDWYLWTAPAGDDVSHVERYICSGADCIADTVAGDRDGNGVRDDNPNDVFADLIDAGNLIETNLYSYSPGVGYALFPSTSFTRMELGRAYWLRLTVAPAEPIAARGEMMGTTQVLPMAGGWNMIGHPLPFSVLLADCQVSDGATTLSMEDAAAAGWLQLPFYFYESGYQRAQISGGEADTLDPWRGYWALVYLPGGVELIIPPIQAP